MTARATPPRSLLLVNCALALGWLAIAIAISAFALHLSVAAVRSGDIGLTDATNGLSRMSESMAERGASGDQVAAALVAAAKARGLAVTTQPFADRAFGPGIGPRPVGPGPPPFGIMLPPSGAFGAPDPFDTPSVVMHVDGELIVLRLMTNPWVPIVQGYALAMGLLVIVALLVTWLVNVRSLQRAFAPMTTVESALRRLASGEYSRLEMIGQEPGEGGVVDAYNGVAEELSTSVRLRAEAESNTRQFVADAGHELRTPLTVIMGFVDVLRQGAIAEPALAQRILDSVATEGERMRRLIARLLMLARLDAVAPERQESVDISQVVSDTVESFRPLAGATSLGVKLESDVTVLGSASDVREIVGILVDNALKYAPGSNVVVTTGRDGRYGVIIVADDGPGMAPDLRVRAFDRFSRGDERGSVPGSGLGLAIVKRIAVRAGGDVELDSTVGQGTRVRVRLPLSSPA